MFLLFLVVCGVIALVIVKVVKPNKAAIQTAAASVGLNTTDWTQTLGSGVSQATDAITQLASNAGGRRMLHMLSVRQTLR